MTPGQGPGNMPPLPPGKPRAPQVGRPQGRLLGDVVEVPPIRLVIQLADADALESDLRQEIVDTFVVTREIEGHLEALLGSLARGQGVGCFVKGHYVSGKSHFLSFLSLLLRRPEAWQRLPHPELHREVQGRTYLQVKVALQKFHAAWPLEDVLMEAAEAEVLRSLGRREVFGDHRLLLESFNSLMLERHPQFLANQELDATTWHALCQRNSLEAARSVASFLDTLPHNPLRTRGERGRSLDRLFAVTREAGLAGVVILLDELSEFLKAKPSPRAFNDDVRFLQFLGEATSHRPLWVIASLQEMLEDIGFEDQELYTRIKERYRYRFSLSSHHVEDLIGGRLVRKKPGAETVIAAAYATLAEAFPHLGLTPERFASIYPVHPATLSLLEGLMGLFSHHRGVVDSVHTRLAGSPERCISAMLDGPADRLLTCEAIFDHFAERIRERPEHAPYVTVAYAALEKEIARLFTQPRDRELATRCVKILILVEISPTERARTAREMADLVLGRVSRIDASLNYQYLKERILDRLVDEAGFVKRTAAPDPLDSVCGIDLETNVAQAVQARTRQALRAMDVGPDLMLRILRQVTLPHLPLGELKAGEATRRHLYWQHTAREGFVILGDVHATPVIEFDGLVDALDHAECDWLLLLGTPHQADRQATTAGRLFEYARRRRMAPLVAAWIPREPSEAELEACLTAMAQRQAHEQALSEGVASEQVAAALKPLLDPAMARLREVVVDCYYDGRVLFADGDDRFPADAGRNKFEAVVLAMLEPALQRAYPDHKIVQPLNMFHRREDMNAAWKHFVLAGTISKAEAESHHISATIEGVFIPLRLARGQGKAYVLVSEVARHPQLSEVLRAVLPGQTVELERLYRTFRKGPWGVSRNVFALMVGILVHLGYCSAYKEGRPVHLSTFARLVDGGVDAIGEGKVLDAAQREQLPGLQFLVGEVTDAAQFTLVTQRDLWQRACGAVEKLRMDVVHVRAQLRSHEGYQAFRALPVEGIEGALDALDSATREVTPVADSREGLARLLRASGPDVVRHHHTLVTWRDFFRDHLAEYKRVRAALAHGTLVVTEDLAPRLARLRDEVAHVAERVERGQWGETWREFQLFVEAYAESYAAEHHRYWSHPSFEAWPALQASPELKVLERLGRIGAVGASHDAVAIRRLLAAVPRPCRLEVREGIALNWRCGCGFAPGQSLPGPGPAQVEEMMRQGLRDYEEALSTPEMREKLEVHAATLDQVGRSEEASRLAEFVAACVKRRVSRRPAAFLPLATDATLDAVNRALGGRTMLMERSLDDLVGALEGRVFTPSRLRDAFELWMAGLPADVYVRVTSARSALPPSAGEDRAVLVRRLELEHELPYLRPEELCDALVEVADHEALAHPVADRLVKQAAEGNLEGPRLLRLAEQIRAAGRDDVCTRSTECFLRLCGMLRDEVAGRSAVEQYVGGVSLLPLLLDRLQHLQFHGSMVPGYLVDGLQDEVKRMVAEHERRFQAEGATLPGLADVASKVVGAAQVLRGGVPAVIFMLDAMRWDVWMQFRPRLEAALSARGAPSVEPILATVPTLTLANRAALLGNLPSVLVTAADRAARRPSVTRLLESGGDVVVHCNFVDERIHATHLGLHALYQELEMELESLVLPYLAEVSDRCIVAVLADHGFSHVPGREPPYRHGGSTAFERIVPCATWDVTATC